MFHSPSCSSTTSTLLESHSKRRESSGATPKRKKSKRNTAEAYHDVRKTEVWSAKLVSDVTGIANLILAYEFEPHRWENLEVGMTPGRRFFDVATYDGKLYSVGGWGGYYFRRNVECLDLKDPGSGWKGCCAFLQGEVSWEYCGLGRETVCRWS